MLDADPQGSLSTWAETATELDVAGPPVIGIGDSLRAQLPVLREGYDIVIVDTPGRQSKRLIDALKQSDLALIPCKPSGTDIWALGRTLEIVEQAKEWSDNLIPRILHNEVNRSGLANMARTAINECPFDSLQTSLGRRVAFAESLVAGKGVCSHAPSSTAATELRWLAHELEELLGIERNECAA